MHPRSHPSRSPSTSLPRGSTPLSTPISSLSIPQYSTQRQYPASQSHTRPSLYTSLHPISPTAHVYMAQSYGLDLSRFPALTHDMYGASTAPIMPHSPSYSSHPYHSQAHPSLYSSPPHSVLTPASIVQSYRLPIAPAPPRDLRDFNDMTSGALSYSNDKSWSMSPSANGSSFARELSRPQVVGSPGRRGILPSVPGCDTPVANGVNGAAKHATVPAKNADGKFPCPHCNKTYLHTKHLKRHLMRHTGDRPYMCVLCKDTFSRSDVLKRHFQKCSIRRGNPMDTTHLSHPEAHLKRSQQQAAQTAAANPAKPLQDEVSNIIPGSNSLMSAPFGNDTVNSNGMVGHQQHLEFTMPPVNGRNRTHNNAFAGQASRASWMAAHQQNSYLIQYGTDPSDQQMSVDRLEQHGDSPPTIT